MDSETNKELKTFDMIVLIAISIYLTHFMYNLGLALLICWKWFSKKYNELRYKKCFVPKASSAAPAPNASAVAHESNSAFSHMGNQPKPDKHLGYQKLPPKTRQTLEKVWTISPLTYQKIQVELDPSHDTYNRYHGSLTDNY